MAVAVMLLTGVSECFYVVLPVKPIKKPETVDQELSSIPGHKEEAQPGNRVMELEDLEHFPVTACPYVFWGAPFVSPNSEKRTPLSLLAEHLSVSTPRLLRRHPASSNIPPLRGLDVTCAGVPHQLPGTSICEGTWSIKPHPLDSQFKQHL